MSGEVQRPHSVVIQPEKLIGITNGMEYRADENTPAADSRCNSTLRQYFTGIRNSAQHFSIKKIAERAVRFFSTLNNGICRVVTGTMTSTMPANNVARSTSIATEMAKDPELWTVRHLNIMSGLLNDGHSDTTCGVDVYNYFKANPDSPTFSSDNLTLSETGTLSFRKPLLIPDKQLQIASVQIDMRDCRNGEFRGKVARNILCESGLMFDSLTDLAAKMTQDPKRNFVAMRSAKMIADDINWQRNQVRSALYLEISAGKYLSDFIIEESGTFKPKHSFHEQAESPAGKPSSMNEDIAAGTVAEKKAHLDAFFAQRPMSGTLQNRKK